MHDRRPEYQHLFSSAIQPSLRQEVGETDLQRPMETTPDEQAATLYFHYSVVPCMSIGKSARKQLALTCQTYFKAGLSK
jgi:hypothetical protein